MSKPTGNCGRAATLFSVLFLTILATAAVGQITGSVHDFSGQGWAGGEICVPCHTPHNADNTIAFSPFWNHEVTNQTFTLYSSPSLDHEPEQPRGPSLLCLSCHDGVTAVDSYGGATGTIFIDGSAKIGTDLSDDHPISLSWTHQTKLPDCGNCHVGSHHNPQDMILPFFDGYLECSTCHDVHNGTGLPRLLRKPLDGSQVCLHCHGK